MSDHLFPQHGDEPDAANWAQLAGHDIGEAYVKSGFDFDVDWTTPEFDVTSGSAKVYADSMTTAHPDIDPQETRSNVGYVVEAEARTGLALADNDVNYVFVDPNRGTDDSPQIEVNTDGSKPTEESLLIGEIDTTNDTVQKKNRNQQFNQLHVDALVGVQRLEAMFEANRIRSNAGIPNAETFGVRSGKSAGLSDSGALSASSELDLASESAVSSAADSGSGTESDPYVIRDRDITADSQVGINFRDGSQDYYVEFVNCRVEGVGNQAIEISSSGSKEQTVFRNCQFFGDTYVVRCKSDATWDQVHFAGTTDNDQFVPEGGADTLVTDCLFDGAQATNPRSEIQPLGNSTTLVKYTRFDGNTKAVKFWKNGSYHFENCHFSVTNALVVDLDATEIHDDIRFKYSKFENADGNYIANGASCQHPDEPDQYDRERLAIEVAYCEFEDNAAESRMVHFTDGRNDLVEDIRVHHCTFDKQTGQSSAGDEVLETFPNGKRVEFDHNWAKNATEDVYEHAYPIEQCFVHHCVADNATGQIVDFFGTADPETKNSTHGLPIESEVHHIYGDCDDVAVKLTDVSDVLVKGHIFAESTGGPAVEIEQRNGPTGQPEQIRVTGPLTRSEATASGPFGTKGDVGTNNWAIWFDDGDIQTYDPAGILVDGRTEIR